ncbi:cytochrome P450 [Lyophyllum atratum]|nr:cytochrome P450 [Lyophyllum atratum]
MVLTERLSVSSSLLLIFFIITSFILIRSTRRRPLTPTTALRGPRSATWAFGLSREILATTNDHCLLFEAWARQYGSVFQVPSLFGGKEVVLCDAKAVAHYYARDTYTYRQTPVNRFVLERFFGKNLLWAEADVHKRQRKVLSSALSNAAIRIQTPVFFDSAYTLKAAWDQTLQSASSDGVIIDVQQWMNRVSLDSIGIAGFSYDFGSLSGRPSQVVSAFEAFGSSTRSVITDIAMLLAPVFPWLLEIPGARKTALQNLAAHIGEIADDLVRNAKREGEGGGSDKSIMGVLVRSEVASQMSSEEIMAQIYLLVLAGYETTAISLTWALIALSKNPGVQQNLRDELAQYPDRDPTWDELTNSLPYLDAVACEALRLFPPGSDTIRQAEEDDIIPLSKPIKDAEGRVIDSVFIAKGTTVRVPAACLNRSEALWGHDAKEFMPERWLDGSISQQRASEIQGHRHILTFVDGPRTCLGKSFALAEFKAVLSVLVRNFTFELPDGPSTKFELHKAILDRPKVAGQDEAKVPLVVRRVC